MSESSTPLCAVVTGGGRGIGRAVALALAQRNYRVALIARSFEQIEGTAALIRSGGGEAFPVRCDVSQSRDVLSAASKIEDVYGVPSVIVNNAGVVHRANVIETDEESWDRTIDINLKGTYLITRTFLSRMLSNGAGRIVAVSSISGTLGTAGMSAYCASKWGVIGFIKSLAEELRETGLQAMCVLPGAVDTEMLKGGPFAPKMTAEDVAAAIVFAAIDAPPAMNGSAVEVFG